MSQFYFSFVIFYNYFSKRKYFSYWSFSSDSDLVYDSSYNAVFKDEFIFSSKRKSIYLDFFSTSSIPWFKIFRLSLHFKENESYSSNILILCSFSLFFSFCFFNSSIYFSFSFKMEEMFEFYSLVSLFTWSFFKFIYAFTTEDLDK